MNIEALQVTIITATRVEAGPLIAALRRPRDFAAGCSKVWCGLLGDISVAVMCSGIGMGKTRGMLQETNDISAGMPILNIGIAGALAASCMPGSWYEAGEILHENSQMKSVTATVTGSFPEIR